MPLVSGTVPNLILGISQEPAPNRTLGQVEAMTNGMPVRQKGAMKRPPFRHVAQLGNPGPCLTHFIDRDATEQYTVLIAADGIQVYDLTGNQKTVGTTGDGYAYLSCADPTSQLTALTVADYTLILNRTKTVAKTADVSSVRAFPEALVYVRQGSYATTYTVIVNGAVGATYTTSATDPATISTINIAAHLAGSLSTNLGVNWEIDSGGVTGTSTIWIKNIAGADFVIATVDSTADKGMIAVKGTVQNFTDLPTEAPNGFIVEVGGLGAAAGTGTAVSASSYYVKFQAAGGGTGLTGAGGLWVETLAPGINTTLDNTTLPHKLVRNNDGTFTLSPITWANRLVGDDSSVPFPSFVGNTLNDLAFFRNRLAFCASDNVILSKSGAFFDFFNASATQLLDTDPIDVTVNLVPSDGSVTIFRRMRPFLTSLLLYGDKTQFVMTTAQGAALSPKTVTVDPATAFRSNFSTGANPVFAGKTVFFPTTRNQWSAIREYAQVPNESTGFNDAPEVSEAVPNLIPSTITRIVASDSEGLLLALTSGAPNVIYCYTYAYNQTSKIQSAWHTWTFPAADTLLGLQFFNSAIYAVFQRGTNIYLEVMNVEVGMTQGNLGSPYYLDRQVLVTGVYNAAANNTTWTLPYADSSGGLQAVVASTGQFVPGLTQPIYPNFSVVAAPGNFAGPAYIGRQYAHRIRLNPIYVKELTRGSVLSAGLQAVVSGILKLGRIKLVYDNAGYFRVEVTPSGGRPMKTKEFNVALKKGITQIDALPVLQAGTVNFNVGSDAYTTQIELVNDSYLPATFVSFDWEGRYFLRSHRI